MANWDKALVLKLAESAGKFKNGLPKKVEHNYPDEECGIGAVLDTETTDLKLPVIEVTEVGVRKFKYHKPTYQFLEALDSFSQLNEPSNPEWLTPIVIEKTGLTMDILKGHKLDKDALKEFLKDVDFIIAHNASYDEKMIEGVLDLQTGIKYHCSQKQINWMGKHDAPSLGLEILILFFGFDNENDHRALGDCDALLHLLVDSNTLPEMLENADTHTIKLVGYLDAKRADKLTPVKDGLKMRENNPCGYWFSFAFDSDPKHWFNDRVAKKDVAKVKAYVEELMKAHNPSGKIDIIITENK